MQNEKAVKAEVNAFLGKLKLWRFMPMMNGFGKTGVGDFVGSWAGLAIMIECKAPHRISEEDGGCSKSQKREIIEFNAVGGVAFVAYGGDCAQRIFRRVYVKMDRRAIWTSKGFISPDESPVLLSDSELELPWAAIPSPSSA